MEALPTTNPVAGLRAAFAAWAHSAKHVLGVYPRTCPVCQAHTKFHAAGDPPRFDARCPSCGSLERHRLFALWLNAHRDVAANKRTLHFAPERVIGALLKRAGAHYISADITRGRADIVENIEAISQPDGSFDLIVCNHVLEHVDHKRALAEFHRVLAPGGLAMLTFPIVEGWSETYENPAITSAQDRILHFGQNDHVRYFGADVRGDIRAAGFRLEEFTACEPDVHRHGLIRGEKLFLAWRD
jgi:SAM-dependent methyltransferase